MSVDGSPSFRRARRLAAGALAAACATALAPPHAAAAPTDVYGLRTEPIPGNPLGLIVEFRTLGEAEPSVHVDGVERSFDVPSTGTLSEVPATLHRVGVVGLRATSDYDISVAASAPPRAPRTRPAPSGAPSDPIFAEDFEDGSIGDWAQVLSATTVGATTGAVPDPAPPIEVLISEPAEMQPGFTLIPLQRTLQFDAQLYVLDSAGEIVWFYDPDFPNQLDETTQLSDGNIVMLNVGENDPAGNTRGTYREVDFMGNTVLEFDDGVLGTPLLHHDVQELPNGNLVSLGVELTPFSYPDVCGGQPSNAVEYNVVTDTIIEFTREGELVDTLSLGFSVFSPYRIPAKNGSAFCLGVYDRYFQNRVTKDLTHINGLVYDPSDDTFIVSARNQNVIAKVNRDTGAFIWVIGENIVPQPGGWPFGDDDHWPFLTPVGPIEYFSQQHGLSLYADGHISIYDNQNEQIAAGEASRALELFPDAGNGQVTQIWDWRDDDYDPELFSLLTGSAVRQPVGTMLVADTAVTPQSGAGRLPRWVRIAEVRQSDFQKVFEIQVNEYDETGVRWIGYNATRIDSLYPPVDD